MQPAPQPPFPALRRLVLAGLVATVLCATAPVHGLQPPVADMDPWAPGALADSDDDGDVTRPGQADYPTWLPTTPRTHGPSGGVSFDDYWTAATHLALAFGGCFIIVATAMIACKSMLMRRADADRRGLRGDGDNESIGSMQRWINERLRDGPPRYEEMNSAASSSASFTTPASDRAAAVTAVTEPTPVTISGALAAATPKSEKPPPYEVVVSETQTRRSSANHGRQPMAENVPPPLYTAMAMALRVGDTEHGFSNPCFLEDGSDGCDPPPYTPTWSPDSSSLSSPTTPSSDASSLLSCLTSLSSATSSTSDAASLLSSMTSLSSCSSLAASTSTSTSASAAEPPGNLLTVSQAVAVKEMMLAEAAASGTTEASDSVFWTSSC